MNQPNEPRQRHNPHALIRAAAGDFAQVLPSHVRPETFVRLALGALNQNAYLAQVASQNPGSLMAALLEAARLGLEPGTDEYYLVPYGGNAPKVEGIVGFQGEVELIYRAGAALSVKAEVVYDRDHFVFDPSMPRPDHRPDWFGDRGEIRGAYAYADMVGGGTSRVVVIGPREIARAQAASASYNAKEKAKRDQSPWNTDPAAMTLKTAVHQLHKWVPTSAEYRREQLRASAMAAAAAAHVEAPTSIADVVADPVTGEIIDAEIVDEDA